MTASKYEIVKNGLRNKQYKWLVTGVAGFIGSNLLEKLLGLNQIVIGLDNFSTGSVDNLYEVKQEVTTQQWANFHFNEGDICELKTCEEVCSGVDIVLHQAALGSVPRSIRDPIATNQTNINGFLNMLVAARNMKVSRLVYAASSSTYGDHQALPKREDVIGKPLSPYAVTKFVNELYADVFAKNYNVNTIGLRYFNVFGKRQNPNGAYAAVIPKWISALKNGEQVIINGDGETSRDFCFVENAIQANILAATTSDDEALNQVYNVAVGDRTSLMELFAIIRDATHEEMQIDTELIPSFLPFRQGDVKHSQADISKAHRLLNYSPEFKIKDGISETVKWYHRRRNLFCKIT